jgi:hypothetical protein
MKIRNHPYWTLPGVIVLVATFFLAVENGWSETPAAATPPAATTGAETASTDNTPDGAAVPFITHEAEDPANKTTGAVVKMTTLPVPGEDTPELEASGRGYVALTDQGQYLEFPNVEEANTIVIRDCIPDAPTGGGITATLSLYVNGEKRQTLTLSSFHNWLYGAQGKNGQSNDPSAGQPHVFWDESRYFIEGGVKKGDTIKLQKDPGDTAAFYQIDLVDIENAPPALPAPAAGTYVSVADYGAKGDGKADDTKAIMDCIAAAKEQKKIVWIPSGTYCQSKHFDLDGVVVQGAGMWYTNLVGTVIGTGFADDMGFGMSGDGSQVHDLCIDSTSHSSRAEKGGKGFTGAGTNWVVQNVWITHTHAGFWIGGTHGVIRGCRVRATYADAMTINNGKKDVAENILAENNSIRGIGDDGSAILSGAASPNDTKNITFRHNTVTCVWWGGNCDLAGGSGHLIERNYWADNTGKECFTINLPPSYPMHPLTGAVVFHNTIVRGGGNLNGQQRGAMWILAGSTSISNVFIKDNQILDSLFRAIHVTGKCDQQMTFAHNTIQNPGGDAIYIEPEVHGSGIFIDNTVTGLKAGCIPIKNASSNYIVTQESNK